MYLICGRLERLCIPGSTQPQCPSSAGTRWVPLWLKSIGKTGKFSHSSHTERVTGNLSNHRILLDTCKTVSTLFIKCVVHGSIARATP